jgi:hypothetical protein
MRTEKKELQDFVANLNEQNKDVQLREPTRQIFDELCIAQCMSKQNDKI